METGKPVQQSSGGAGSTAVSVRASAPMLLQSRLILRCLGIPDGRAEPEKPKWMRWSTFERELGLLDCSERSP